MSGKIRLNLGRKSAETSDDSGPVQVVRKPVVRSTKIPAAGNLLRDRGKRASSDISEIWSSKNIDDHIDVEDELPSILRSKIVISSMRSLRRAKHALPKKHNRNSLQSQVVHPARNASLYGHSGPKPSTKGVPLGPNASGASTLDMVAARPKARVQPRRQRTASLHAVNIWRRVRPDVHKLLVSRRFKVIVISCACILAAGTLISKIGSRSDTEDKGTSQSLGASVSSESLPDSGSGPEIVTDTEFQLLIPAGKDVSDFEVAKVSPPENAPVYAFIDTFQGVELRLSQQEMPPEFKDNQAEKLAQVAKDFQATDVIQIDDMKVYHGFTERFGGVQSLVFIKKDVMVFISSAKKFSDDDWAGYILGLD